jgi:hypothetical protein
MPSQLAASIFPDYSADNWCVSSNVRSLHKADIPKLPINVRYWGECVAKVYLSRFNYCWATAPHRILQHIRGVSKHLEILTWARSQTLRSRRQIHEVRVHFWKWDNFTAKKAAKSKSAIIFGGPERSRISDLRFRNALLGSRLKPIDPDKAWSSWAFSSECDVVI